MSTKKMEQFEVMDEMALSNIEGGKNQATCILSVAALGAAGTMYGSPIAGAIMAGVAARTYC
ncbi:bacteriocin class II family protein [Streptococcus pluranimalium]|uniref:bacteriocin class II family protein n=1 Tax=Streptococcus pluranimalium TaxID=82348 RepID=UPI004046A06C